MSQPNQLVNHVQQRKSQIAGMLSLGSGRSRARQGGWNFSPIARDFGGRKFQLAAQKMRMLDRNILGPSFSERAMNMANTIQAKFENPKSLLHLSPAAKGEKSFWSEVEQVFPIQVSGQAETPGEPGVLRRGSVIQRFETFPQPGQSLKSFKEQVQSRPTVRQSDQISPPKKSNLAPRDRLSARIQELTTHPKEKRSAEQSSVDQPIESSSTHGEVIQRQPEQAVPSEPGAAKTPEAFESSKSESPQRRLIQTPKADRPDLPTALPVRRLAKPVSSKTVLPKATPKASPSQSQSRLRPEQPARRPASSSSASQTIQRQMETGKLAQKIETTQPRIQPSEKTPEPAAKVPTPQEHLPARPELAKSPPEIPPGGQPPISMPEAAALTSTLHKHVPAKPEHPQRSLEMPLAQHLQRRSAAIESLRPGVTQVPPTMSPKIPGSTTSPIQRKAIISSEGPGPAASTPAAHPLLQRKPSQLSLHHPTAVPQAPSTSIGPALAEAGTAVKTTTTPIELVQRRLVETVGDEDKEEEPSSPAAQEATQKPENVESSPEQLAEKILPLVKRLLEIESERTGRQLH